MMGVLEHDSSMHELADHCYAISPLKCSLPVLARPILKVAQDEKCVMKIFDYSFCIVHVLFLLVFMYVHLM